MVNFSSRKCLACQWLEILKREFDVFSGGKPRFPYKAPASRKPRSYNKVKKVKKQFLLFIFIINFLILRTSYFSTGAQNHTQNNTALSGTQ
jgi:hypothetical protein